MHIHLNTHQSKYIIVYLDQSKYTIIRALSSCNTYKFTQHTSTYPSVIHATCQYVQYRSIHNTNTIQHTNTIQIKYELNIYFVCIVYGFGFKYKPRKAIHTNLNRENHWFWFVNAKWISIWGFSSLNRLQKASNVLMAKPHCNSLGYHSLCTRLNSMNNNKKVILHREPSWVRLQSQLWTQKTTE